MNDWLQIKSAAENAARYGMRPKAVSRIIIDTNEDHFYEVWLQNGDKVIVPFNSGQKGYKP